MAKDLMSVELRDYVGRVLDQRDRSASTAGVRELTRRITSDPDWIATLVPIRDGVIVAYKR